ncbi:hydrolase [Betaproteobacteria bacterium GR16-43]|nr:hydrolase [Betaproteobacteria bacterium GR16-43]
MTTPFSAPGWLRNPHLQTLYGSLLAPKPQVAYRRERWDTYDGDFVDLDFIDGPAGTPWVHLFHGLEGSSGSPYAKHLMALVKQRGWRGSVLNFRGCSGEPNRLARAYHSGDTPEVDWVLGRLKALAGDVPFYAAGVSLGGNVLLKWLGEQGDAALPRVTRAVAISAPVDLMAAGWALQTGFSSVYGKHFLSTLRKRSFDKLARFPGIFDGAKARAAKTLREFDDIFTAPIHGFAGVDDYYTRASSKPFLPAIRVPTLLLNAKDDPFLPERYLPRADEVSNAVKIEFPEQGGHVGFVSGFPGRIEWLPNRLMTFFERGA